MKPETYEQKLERWKEGWRKEDDDCYIYEVERRWNHDGDDE